MKASIPLLLSCAVITGCAATYEPAALAATNPASAQAEEAPYARPKHLAGSDSLSAHSGARLAGKTASVPPNQKSRRELYVCPMHPEVRSDKPGQCPKCGMTLVKK